MAKDVNLMNASLSHQMFVHCLQCLNGEIYVVTYRACKVVSVRRSVRDRVFREIR
jgi:hypothetical protein